jgi:phosphoglycolate phosphatase|tara:strand:- start:18762 stop:19529 length:768 start_codon:yes stop_codon:yes gene_type:complete
MWDNMVNFRLDDLEINNIELIIFDKDGTLVDLYHYWSQMTSLRSKLICEKLKLDLSHKKRLDLIMGVDEKEKKLREDGPVGVKKREIVMQVAIDYLESYSFDNVYKICFNAFEEVNEISSSKLSKLIKPINGLYELFENLVKSSCKIAIATTDTYTRTKLIMDYLDLRDKTDYIIGADLVKECKPSPEMINKILKDLSIEKEKTIMVGDAITDIEMGLNAKIKASVGVCTGLNPREKLLEKTKYVINDISEIRIV